MTRTISLFFGLALSAATRAQAAPPTHLASPILAPADAAMLAAGEAELLRAMQIEIPGQPKPYYIAYEFLDGQVATAHADSGVLLSFNDSPYRNVRVEVRVGDYTLDNSRFEGGFGVREGVVMKGLPADPSTVAFRRELWLATDYAYKGAAEQLSGKLSSREGRLEDDNPVHSYEQRDGVTTTPVPMPKLDAQATQARMRTLSEKIGALPGLENAEAIGRDWVGRRLLITSEGTRAWIPTGFSVVRVEGVVRTPNGRRLRDCRWWVARTPEELPPLEQMVAEVEEMAASLLAAIDAPIEPDYLGPVLFEGPAAVELFRQLLVPEVSGTPPVEMAPDPYSPADSRPAPTARIGRRLLPEGWSVVDDPTRAAGSAGAYALDFEGVEASRVNLVDNGVLKDVLMSRVPRTDMHGSTGHGRGLGPEPREASPSAITVSPGHTMSEKKLRKRALNLARQADLDYVLVVKRIEPPALAEDFEVAFTGDGPLAGLTRPLEVVRLYRDGREEAVQPGMSFLGVDRRVLRDIAGAGDVGELVGVLDAPAGPRRHSLGAVGGLPAAWAVPPVVVTELELRAGGGGQPRAIPAPTE